jgi:large subunit ribosomal protein L18
MRVRTRRERRRRIKYRIRKKLSGTKDRPRLCVYRSLRHIYAQVIDDEASRTLVAAASVEKDFPTARGQNTQAAVELGKIIARRTMEKGINSVLFDRNGFGYHGRIKAVAEAARESGLRF